MPWVVRYEDAPHPGRPFLALMHTGEWGTSAKSRAQRFATPQAAEVAVREYCRASRAFALESHASALRRFTVEEEDGLDPEGRRCPVKQARTLWDRILEDD